MAPKRPLDEPSTSKALRGKRARHSPPPISSGNPIASSHKSESNSKTNPSADMGPPSLPIVRRSQQEKGTTELAQKIQLIREWLDLLLVEDEATIGSVLKKSVSVRNSLIDDFLRDLASPQPLNKPTAEAAERTFGSLPDPPQSAPRYIRDLVESINLKITHILILYATFVSKLTAQPAPSEYAKAEVWAQYQTHGQPILCLRPCEKRGLPLVMLHEVFRLFAIQVTKSLPDTPIAHQVKRAAQELCRLMPNHFKEEKERRDKFNSATEAIIGWQNEQTINAQNELHGGRVDAWHINAEMKVRIIREDRVENGSGGDPYMQVCRDYQILVSQAKENDEPLIKEGYPIFILTVAGPQLWVCGGFWDGDFPVVEPLTPACIMLPDFLEAREDLLARTLYALRCGVDFLNGPRPSLPSCAPGVPRVFQNFQPFVGDSQPITFLSRFDESYSHLMFLAEVYESSSPVSVIVKFCSRPYGEAVHRHLAELNLAPAYRGKITLEGTSTGHVMDFMEPPADGQSGWITLFKFGSSSEYKGQVATNRGAIRKSLDRLLRALKNKSFVHGDLRSNNILIEVNGQGAPQVSHGTAHIQVVDFDWAGTSGEARYPETLNKDIQWSAGIGAPIECSHDNAMVDRWWKVYGS